MIMNIDLEVAFRDFIDGRDYDTAEASLFDCVRAAFLAGYDAATNNASRTIAVISGDDFQNENRSA